MYGLGDYQFYGYWLYFLFLSVVLFWFAGWQELNWIEKGVKKEKLSRTTKFFLAPVLGIVSLTVVAWLSGTLKIYNAVYVYQAVWLVVAVWQFWKKIKSKQWRRGIKNKKLWREWWRQNWGLLTLIVLGLLIQMPAIFGSGLRVPDGVRFFFTNYQDGLMHLGFIESLAQGFPPMRPEVNEVLHDYHYFSDLLMAQLARVGVPAVNLFFQFMPVLLSIVTTGVIYQAILLVTKNKKAAVLTTLTFLLAGDGGYILTFFFKEGKGWEMATFDNGADQFLNMPFVMAKMIFFSAWLLLNQFWRERQKKIIFALMIVLMTLTLFKVYWLFFFLAGWGVVLGIQFGQNLITKRKMNWTEIGCFLLTAGVSYCLLLSIGSGAADGLTFVPLVWPREIASVNHLNWFEWFLQEQNLLSVHSWQTSVDLLKLNIKLVGMTMIFIFGARLIGLLIWKKTIRLLRSENVWFFVSAFFIWTFIGLNFLQVRGGYNTFNFFILAGVALLIPLGVNLANWWDENKKRTRWQKICLWVRRGLVMVVLILLAPRTIRNVIHYWQITDEQRNYEVGYCNNEKLEIFEKTRELTVVNEVIGVRPRGSFEGASTIPGLAARKTYLSNQFILESHNYDFEEKNAKMKEIFEKSEIGDFKNSLRELGVGTVVLMGEDREKMNAGLIENLTKEAVFQNSEGMIIKID